MRREIIRNWNGSTLRRVALASVFIAVAAVVLSGCNSVRRRLTITTEPSGAIVYLNNKEIGRSPISYNFVHSGVYEIRCYKEGYKTERQYYKAGTPWYLYPGIDFFSENFVAGELRDEQSCHIEMTPRSVVPLNELKEQAAQMRAEAQGVKKDVATFTGPLER